MKQKTYSEMKKIGLTLCMGMAMVFSAKTGIAQNRERLIDRHPGYGHAMSDLRAARWLIDHKAGDWVQGMDERAAVHEIDDAMREIREAALDDGKRIDEHPQLEERNEHMGRLHEAMDFLRKSREDLMHGEDDAFGNRLRERTFRHIDKAMEDVKRASHS